MSKIHIKKGDTVVAITGEDKGKQGRVLAIFTDKRTALVEGLNLVSRHTKPNQKQQKGGILKKEAPVHISNLLLPDPTTGEPTRIGRKEDKDGKLRRYAKNSGEFIKK